MKRFLMALVALMVAAPAGATTLNAIKTRTEGSLGVYLFNQSLASGVVDTSIVTTRESFFEQGNINGTVEDDIILHLRFWNVGTTAAADSISFGVDGSMDGELWTSLRNIALTGFIGGVGRDVFIADYWRYLRFRTVNRRGTAMTVEWVATTPAAKPE